MRRKRFSGRCPGFPCSEPQTAFLHMLVPCKPSWQSYGWRSPLLAACVAAQTTRRKLEWCIPDAVYARPNIIALQISMHFNKIVVECIIISATATYAIVDCCRLICQSLTAIIATPSSPMRFSTDVVNNRYQFSYSHVRGGPDVCL